jgi:hypothetical protein
MTMYKISDEIRNQLINHLHNQPFIQVHHLITALSKLESEKEATPTVGKSEKKGNK